jgi:hypothetical protein
VPKPISVEAERQELTGGISLLTTKDGDAGFVYQVSYSVNRL